MPLRRPAGVRVTPLGRVPAVTLKVGAGVPVAVTGNDPPVPTVNVVLEPLVKPDAHGDYPIAVPGQTVAL